MKRNLLLSLIFTLFMGFISHAQRTVSGKVTDDSGEPVPGANVILKGTTTGTTTDLDGNYRLSVPEEGGILTISFVGMMPQEVEIGSRSVINVGMKADATELSEVVVTALGLETDRDKLGTAISTVDGTAVAQSGEATLINGLSAKMSGVNIVRSSGDPGAGSYIQIRGQSTITGNLQPLIVIDGVPIYNSTLGNGTGDSGGVVQQSRLNDINPNDIANVEVLKGASAAALWGTRAANGVIIITTKSGKSNKGKLNVSINSTVSVDKVYITHDLQNRWGGGTGGNYQFTPSGGLSWGDFIPDRAGGENDFITNPSASGYQGYFVAKDGSTYYAVANGSSGDSHGGARSKDTYDYKDELFKTGYYFDNTVSLSGGDSDANFYLSIGNLTQQGVIKTNSDYDRTTFRLKAEKRFGTIFKASSNFSYSKIKSSRIQMGSNLSGLYLGGLRTRADFNMADYVGTYYDAPDGQSFANRQRAYRNPLGASTSSVYDNPIWMMHNVEDRTDVDRFIGGFQMDANATDWLTLTGRFGVDHYNDFRHEYWPIISAGANAGGRYNQQSISETQFNLDVFGNSQFKLSEDISLNVIVGMNFNSRVFNNTFAEAYSFIADQKIYNVTNASSTNTNTGNDYQAIRTAALYGTANLSWKNQVFLSGTARAENASSFEGLIFYPSADIAWQFTEAIDLSPVLSFGKLRGAFGTVGVQPSPYNTTTYYAIGGYGESWGPSLSANAETYGGGYTESTTLGNPNLKPERKTEFEVGADLRFFQDRISLSGTYFQNKTTGAILDVATAYSAGFTSKTANAGAIKNHGVEFDWGIDVLKVGDFKWNISGNFTRYRNKVTSLAGTTSIFLAGFTGTSSRAVENHPLGVLWGVPYARDSNGKIQLDDYGFPVQSTEEGVLGNPNPDYKMGLGTTFTYKGFKLYVLGDFTKGGDIWAGTYSVLKYFGRAKDTDVTTTVSAADAASLYTYNTGETVADTYSPNADGTYSFRGKVENFGGKDVALDQSWYTSLGGGFGAVSEDFIMDATNYRLREVTLSYSFKILQNSTNLTLSASGRNLLIVGPSVKKIGNDPETNLTGSSNGRGLDYFNNPATRSYYFTVGINF